MTTDLPTTPASAGDRAAPAIPVGLTSAEAIARAAAGESNDFRPPTSRTYRAILRDNLINPFNITLATLIVILVALGQPGDSLFSAFAVVVNTAVALVQEVRAKWQLDALARLTRHEARVLRDGVEVDIPDSNLVRGDVVVLRPGDQIPTDGSTVQADALEVSESLITGESEPIGKGVGDPLTSGSYVVAGSGAMVSERVGAASFVNSLGMLATRMKYEATPLQRKVDAIVWVSVLVMCLFAPLHVVASFETDTPFVDLVRNSITLITTFVPQGVVLATTVALTFGAIRISRRHTLVQRLNAVESMANVTVLCLDKTGTLTENRLAVVGLVPLGGTSEQDLRTALARHAGLVSAPNATIEAVARATDPQPGTIEKRFEVPFTSTRKWGAVVAGDGRATIFGAPELVLAESNRAAARELAATGHRVVALATTDESDAIETLGTGALPAVSAALGLVVIQDRIRPGIRDVLRGFDGRGIDLKIISGDSPETVRAIAAEAGIESAAVLVGRELESMSEAEFGGAVRDGVLFARITPDMKRRIILRLRDEGEYVAMVGDGVNDVPALKAARLGIAMHDGAQMAREVSELVLLDNDIATLPRALDEGERTIEKAYATSRIFLSKNFYMVLMFIMVGYAQLPFPGQVREVSWATFVTAAVPATLIAFDLIRPKPIRRFVRNVVGYILVVGTVGAILLTAAYIFAFESSGHDVELARSFLIL
ncbi:MAG TPA: HAD-IC family P-type ATPase, partial [Candidatus Limnocylindrales bacterium]|nr:HAD-IC family P-type ATPase [Candidatus Limnocylindrales bacterium]